MNQLLQLLKIPETRQRIMLTLGLLFVYRLGFHVPVPGLSASFLREQAQGSTVFGLMSAFTGGSIGNTVIFALGISRSPTLLLALPLLGLVGITFASIALVFNALAKGYDFFTYYFTLVITPMTFLSGVYFPIEQMPGWLQAVAQVLPLKAGVDLVRPLVLGEMPADVFRPLATLFAYAAGGYYLALVLTRRRFFG